MHMDPTVLNTHDLAWKVLGKTKISWLRKICFRVFIAFPTIHWISPSTFQITQVKQPLWNQKDHFFPWDHTMDPSSCYTPIWPRWRSREPDPKTVHLFLEKSGQLMSTPKSSKSRKLGKPLATHLATAQLQPLCHRRTWSARWEDRSTQPLPMPGAGTPQNVVCPILHHEHHHHQLQYAQPWTVPKKQWFSMI